MNNKIDVKINDLITIHSKLEECLNCLDTKNTEHRQLVIQAMEEYLKKYVTPALYLMPNIDLNDVFEKHITGLGLDFLFDSKRENLDRPSDEELDCVFEQVIDLKPTPELKNKFWDSWLVDESFSCIRKLCNFLDEPLTFNQYKQIKPDVLRREIEQIQYILTLEMTPGFEQWIEGVLKWERKALAEWNEEITIS